MALNNQTNINPSRYFFATTEAGAQTLGLQYGTTGGSPSLSTMSVTISGSGGNGVVVNYAPAYGASEYMIADGGLLAGSSAYFTPSTLTTTTTGINLSADRIPGSGVACIESYGGNGAHRGVEFLSRGLDSELLSSGTIMDGYLSTIGRPGAGAVLGTTGTLVTPSHTSGVFNAYTSPPTGSGQGIYNISDLSGANGVTPQLRWGIGTTNTPTGGNAGCDYALFAYGDAGNFLNSPYQVRRSDGAMAISNLSSINGTPFDLSGMLPWEVYTVTNTATQSVALTAGVAQTVLTFTDIPIPAQGLNAGGLAMSVPISVSCAGLTNTAIVNLTAFFGGSVSGGSGVANTTCLSSNLAGNRVTLSGVAIHNGTSNRVDILAVADTTATYDFVQGSGTFNKFFFQTVF